MLLDFQGIYRYTSAVENASPSSASPFVPLTNDALLVYTLSHKAVPTKPHRPSQTFLQNARNARRNMCFEPVRQTRSLSRNFFLVLQSAPAAAPQVHVFTLHGLLPYCFLDFAIHESLVISKWMCWNFLRAYRDIIVAKMNKPLIDSPSWFIYKTVVRRRPKCCPPKK